MYEAGMAEYFKIQNYAQNTFKDFVAGVNMFIFRW